jgi:hypothetical protein
MKERDVLTSNVNVLSVSYNTFAYKELVGHRALMKSSPFRDLLLILYLEGGESASGE